MSAKQGMPCLPTKLRRKCKNANAGQRIFARLFGGMVSLAPLFLAHIPTEAVCVSVDGDVDGQGSSFLVSDVHVAHDGFIGINGGCFQVTFPLPFAVIFHHDCSWQWVFFVCKHHAPYLVAFYLSLKIFVVIC